MKSKSINFLRKQKKMRAKKVGRVRKEGELYPYQWGLRFGGVTAIAAGMIYLYQEKLPEMRYVAHLAAEVIFVKPKPSHKTTAQVVSVDSIIQPKSESKVSSISKLNSIQDLAIPETARDAAVEPTAASPSVAWIEKLDSTVISGVSNSEAEVANGAVSFTLNSDEFFEIGTANLVEAKESNLRKFVDAIAVTTENVTKTMRVEIEGYTDDSPVVKQRKLYRSNWELSAARAASLVHIFEAVGFTKDRLKVVGYGESRPILPNRNADGTPILSNLAKNRRIILRLLNE